MRNGQEYHESIKTPSERHRGAQRGILEQRERRTAHRVQLWDSGAVARAKIYKYPFKPLSIVTSDRRKRGILESKNGSHGVPFFRCRSGADEARGKREKVRTLRPLKSSSLRGI